MAYQDPYAGQYGGYQHQQQPSYSQPQYGQQQYGNYGDAGPEFNPYTTSAHAHPTYEQGAYDQYGGGYRDDPGHNEPSQRQASQHGYADAPPPTLQPKSVDERSSFDPGEFTPSTRGPK